MADALYDALHDAVMKSIKFRKAQKKLLLRGVIL